MTYDELQAAGKSDPVWYAPRSVYSREIVPQKRMPGGGVLQDDLTDYATALDRCIEYTRDCITTAEMHLKDLIARRQT